MATVYSLICFGGRTGKTVTLSIASPCVVTLTNHGLRDGTGVAFSTTGALPTGITAGTTYYARSTAANTFNLYDTAAHAIAGGATGQINTSGSQSGTHTIKGAYFLGLSADELARYGSAGSERIYDGLVSWNSNRSGASGLDHEVCEIGQAWSDITSATFNVTVPAGAITITATVNGIWSEAFHGGQISTAGGTKYGYCLEASNSNVTVLGASKPKTTFYGFTVLVQNSGYAPYIVSSSAILSKFRNMISRGKGSGSAFYFGGACSEIVNCIGMDAGSGIYLLGYNSGLLVANNTFTKNTTGVDGITYQPVYASLYNNISVGNTTNWNASVTGIVSATNNAGLSGEAWITGSGTRVTMATTDFVDFTNNDFRPASATSPQTDAGASYYGSDEYAYDLADDVRPSYENGTTTYFDIGAFEYDHGYGPWPETLLTITDLVAGSTVRVFTSGTQTELASTTNSGTSYSPSGLSPATVDYTIYKDGYIPVRVTGVVLVSGATVTQSGAQTLDRAFAASSGLTYGTTATVNTSTKQFGVTTATTGQNWYSFWIEQYRQHSDLRNKAFPLQANGPNSFTLRDGYEFDGTTSLGYISRDGIRYTDASGTMTAAWAAILSVNVPSGLQVRYQQADGAAPTAAASTGNIDQLVKIYGDASHGNIDYRGFLVCKVQEQGYDQGEVDVVAQYGSLEDQLYVVSILPTANGVATGDPGALSVTITDHGASPVTWNAKQFSITITDSATTSGTSILRWIRYAQDTGATLEGKNAFNWHDLVQTNGDKFKGVRGAVYGDTGASLKGVRILRGVDAHPDFTIHTADDGTTVSTTPPALASAAVLANTRVQLYNVTTATELHNTFVTGTTYSYEVPSGVNIGDTVRLRVCKLGYVSEEATAIWAATGATFVLSQVADAVYTAWGVDGSTVTEFAPDVTGHIYIESNDPDGVTTKVRLGAWFSYLLTTENGIRYFYGTLSFLAENEIRVNTAVANVLLENVNATTALRFSDVDVRLYRDDGASLIAPTSYSLHLDYSGVPDVVETGVSGLTTAESNQLMGLNPPSAATIAASVWSEVLA